MIRGGRNDWRDCAPTLFFAFVDGTVERRALDEAPLAPWTAADVSTLLAAVGAWFQRSPRDCHVRVRWLPGHRVETV